MIRIPFAFCNSFAEHAILRFSYRLYHLKSRTFMESTQEGITMKYDEELGARIAQARELRGIAQAEVARQMRRLRHVTIMPGRMSEIEHGRRSIRPAELADLCRILRVPPWWLLGLRYDESKELDESWR